MTEPDYLIACARRLDDEYPARTELRARMATFVAVWREHMADSDIAAVRRQIIALVTVERPLTPAENDRLASLIALWREHGREAVAS